MVRDAPQQFLTPIDFVREMTMAIFRPRFCSSSKSRSTAGKKSEPQTRPVQKLARYLGVTCPAQDRFRKTAIPVCRAVAGRLVSSTAPCRESAAAIRSQRSLSAGLSYEQKDAHFPAPRPTSGCWSAERIQPSRFGSGSMHRFGQRRPVFESPDPSQ